MSNQELAQLQALGKQFSGVPQKYACGSPAPLCVLLGKRFFYHALKICLRFPRTPVRDFGKAFIRHTSKYHDRKGRLVYNGNHLQDLQRSKAKEDPL